jgi:release factor glutamine methyltransferase
LTRASARTAVFAELGAGMPIGSARRRVAAAFRSAEIDSPELDARLLVGEALGLDHAGLAAAANDPLDAEQVEAIAALATRRLAHEPVARILGRKEFWGLPLELAPATLVPRPETETVVEAALAELDHSVGRTKALRILDLGTGSGALLLALLAELPQAFGIGTDISLAALEVARRNARATGSASRARFVLCDLGSALGGRFDLIVSNPPYIARGAIAELAPEVRDHDPGAALDGGPDGLDCYRAIAVQAPSLLAASGRLAVELGEGQAGAVQTLFAQAGLRLVATRPDLSGIPRALVVEPSG